MFGRVVFGILDRKPDTRAAFEHAFTGATGLGDATGPAGAGSPVGPWTAGAVARPGPRGRSGYCQP
ncbi:hypothetical protein [Streptomyces xanthophaeus]|uniref:Uncharacterized protein n=1 Tax=Streptomyces xanthophaeus TaxID=67385 RepID=A0A919LJ25_9ACTN|nr:hypothetical protein [Streptomyces xanthophaeus]GHI86074.1 hypothetical protein Sxan_34380 [Streptomyces xanthophaeus]